MVSRYVARGFASICIDSSSGDTGAERLHGDRPHGCSTVRAAPHADDQARPRAAGTRTPAIEAVVLQQTTGRGAAYRVFEALDELVTHRRGGARGLLDDRCCVVPRGTCSTCSTTSREALPAEVDDAQDVLDHREQMIGDAKNHEPATLDRCGAGSHPGGHRRAGEAESMVSGRNRGGPAGGRCEEAAEDMVARARAEAERSCAPPRNSMM